MKLATIVAVLAVLGWNAFAQGNKTDAPVKGKPLYGNNFEKSALDSVPEEMLVLDGAFAVKQEGDNRFLELPGNPLDTFGVLFGPNEKDGLAVAARVYGTGKGRRFPAFAVGLNGVAGFRLQVSPAKKLVELFRNDTVKTSVPFEWESGKWTELRLQLQKTKAGEWRISGKAWMSGTAEPGKAMIEVLETEEPPAGRASIWGNPFSGTPIRFDDLAVAPASEKP